MNNRVIYFLYGIIFLGYVVLVRVFPSLILPDSSLPNVAAQSGYNTGVAYIVIALWSVTAILLLALFRWKKWNPVFFDSGKSSTFKLNTVQGIRPWVECLVIAAFFVILYWPQFLARYGFYIEDQYFVNVLARMQCGQLPYRDFEFLYGPLMIYPAHAWMNLMGFTLTGYYALIALLQGIFFAALYRLFQLHVPDTRFRYITFIIFIPFVFDSLLGLNYTGWRIMFALLAILVVAAQPYNKKMALLAGIVCGMQLAFSYEFGIIALITITAIYISAFFNNFRRDAVIAGLITIFVSLIMAIGIIKLFTGNTFDDYISATFYTLNFAQTTGLGNFRFYWTLNSLAFFGLLSIAVVTVGLTWARLFNVRMNYGDRLMFGALLFALGSLKIAMQRADIWHITLPFIPLILVFLWRIPAKLFAYNRVVTHVIFGFVILASVTRTIGILPMTAYFMTGWAKGASDIMSNKPNAGPVESRRYSTLSDLTQANKERVKIANYLSLTEHRNRPVIFYGNRWSLAAQVGVCPSGYSFYQLMYTDSLQPLQGFLQENRNTFIVMDKEMYIHLFEGSELKQRILNLSVPKKVASWASSIHYEQKIPEQKIKQQIWRQNLGDYLVTHYQARKILGKNVILQRKAPYNLSKGVI